MMQILPEYKLFTEKFDSDTPQIVWANLSSDVETPVSTAVKLQDEEFLCLFESVEQGKNRGRYSALCLKPDVLWKCENNVAMINRDAANDLDKFVAEDVDVLTSLRGLIKESYLEIPDGLPVISSGLFGYMSYDMVRLIENIPDDNPENIGIPESLFMRAGVVIIFDSVKDQMSIAVPIFNYKTDAQNTYMQASQLIASIIDKLTNSQIATNNKLRLSGNCDDIELAYESNTTKDEYCKMVERAKEYILAGDIFQVVPSQRFVVDFDYDALSLYRALRHLNPSPYSFLIRMGDFALVGSSPEILVRANNSKVTVRPIAGTRRRGKNEAEDKQLGEDLLSDEKELAEHLMLIDLGRNDVGRVAKIGSVKVTEQMILEYYSHVMHIVSNVEGELRDDVDTLDAVMAGFPVGTVSGAPKIRAMEIIDELEKTRRSFYAGGVGYFSSSGDVDTCITLRTGLVKDGKLYVQAGGGVVADSDADDEYWESCYKSRALFTAAKQVIRSHRK